jgi:hypothetical protein
MSGGWDGFPCLGWLPGIILDADTDQLHLPSTPLCAMVSTSTTRGLRSRRGTCGEYTWRISMPCSRGRVATKPRGLRCGGGWLTPREPQVHRVQKLATPYAIRTYDEFEPCVRAVGVLPKSA